jgi:hypothetical protein
MKRIKNVFQHARPDSENRRDGLIVAQLLLVCRFQFVHGVDLALTTTMELASWDFLKPFQWLTSLMWA